MISPPIISPQDLETLFAQDAARIYLENDWFFNAFDGMLGGGFDPTVPTSYGFCLRRIANWFTMGISLKNLNVD